jgi:hypothetical protein
MSRVGRRPIRKSAEQRWVLAALARDAAPRAAVMNEVHALPERARKRGRLFRERDHAVPGEADLSLGFDHAVDLCELDVVPPEARVRRSEQHVVRTAIPDREIADGLAPLARQGQRAHATVGRDRAYSRAEIGHV